MSHMMLPSQEGVKDLLGQGQVIYLMPLGLQLPERDMLVQVGGVDPLQVRHHLLHCQA